MITKKATKKKLTIAGLYLWLVRVSRETLFRKRRETVELWITTPTNSLKRAVEKTEAVMKRDKWTYPKGKVEGAEQRGQLDA